MNSNNLKNVEYKKFKDVEIGTLFLYWGIPFKKVDRNIRESIDGSKQRFETNSNDTVLIIPEGTEL